MQDSSYVMKALCKSFHASKWSTQSMCNSASLEGVAESDEYDKMIGRKASSWIVDVWLEVSPKHQSHVGNRNKHIQYLHTKKYQQGTFFRKL